MVVFAEAPAFADVLLGPVGPAWANVADNASEPAAAARMAIVFFTSPNPLVGFSLSDFASSTEFPLKHQFGVRRARV